MLYKYDILSSPYICLTVQRYIFFIYNKLYAVFKVLFILKIFLAFVRLSCQLSIILPSAVSALALPPLRSLPNSISRMSNGLSNEPTVRSISRAPYSVV